MRLLAYGACLDSGPKQFTEKGNEHLPQMLLMQQGGRVQQISLFAFHSGKATMKSSF